MGHHHQPGVLGESLLPDALDAHLVIRKGLGHLCQNSRAVDHLEHDVILARHFLHMPDAGGVPVTGTADTTRTVGNVAGHIDDISYNRGGGRGAPSTPPVEHQLAYLLAFDEDRVEVVPDRGQGMGRGNHRRMYPHRDLTVEHLPYREQLHRVPESSCEGDVTRGYSGYAFAIDVSGNHSGVEGDARQYRQLGGGIESFDVGSWVEFGVAEAFRFGEGLVELQAIFAHTGEDEVGRAVDDSHHPADPLSGKRLFERLDDRNASGDRPFEIEIDSGMLGPVEQVLAECGEKLFVGGDDLLAGVHCLEDEAACRLNPPHYFDQDLNSGIGDHASRIAREKVFGQWNVSLLCEVSDRHLPYFQTRPDALGDLPGVGVENPRHGRSDNAATEHSYPDDLCHTVKTVASWGPRRPRPAPPAPAPRRPRRPRPAGPRKTVLLFTLVGGVQVVTAETYGDFAELLGEDPPWVIGTFPLSGGRVWEMREPEAVTIVRDGILWVAVPKLTRFHDRSQILDNAKHVLFSTRRFEVPDGGGISFELSMRVRRNGALPDDLFDCYGSFLCLDFSNGTAMDWFLAEEMAAATFARLPFPGLELTNAKPLKYWAIFQQSTLQPTADGFHRLKLVIEPEVGVVWWADGSEISRKKAPPYRLGDLTLGLAIMTEKDLTPMGSVSIHGQGILAEWAPIEVRSWVGDTGGVGV